jgi:hypothetical protein
MFKASIEIANVVSQFVIRLHIRPENYAAVPQLAVIKVQRFAIPVEVQPTAYVDKIALWEIARLKGAEVHVQPLPISPVVTGDAPVPQGRIDVCKIVRASSRESPTATFDHDRTFTAAKARQGNALRRNGIEEWGAARTSA